MCVCVFQRFFFYLSFISYLKNILIHLFQKTYICFDTPISKNVYLLYKCYLPAGRSVLRKTVSEVLSTARLLVFKCLTPVNKTCLSRIAFTSHQVQWDEFSVVRSFLVLFTDERNPSLRQSYSLNSYSVQLVPTYLINSSESICNWFSFIRQQISSFIPAASDPTSGEYQLLSKLFLQTPSETHQI